jgi:2-polyprenyl-6-methoxyphenol hydroxylase-like FAD-dependent oxidoreductase
MEGPIVHSHRRSPLIGRRAIVVGAGFAGLCAARALADRFERVSVLERDTLPPAAMPRPGVPQGLHAHALSIGGQRALERLFPGFEQDLICAGAVAVRAGLDVRVERPGYDPYPQRDFGLASIAASRSLIEFQLRRRVERHPAIDLRTGCRVMALAASAAGDRVTGVRCEGGRGIEGADLVVDASGRGALTLSLLEAVGQPLPGCTTIGIDRGYATVTFELPPQARPDWQGLVTLPLAPQGSRAVLIYPLEGGSWIMSTGGRHDDQPPRAWPAILEYLRGLRTPTAFETMRAARDLSTPAHFLFRASEWRHFEQVPRFPAGLLPIGDAISVFNPAYGQGMGVAAQEARLLQELLARAAAAPDDGLSRLAADFFAGARALVDTPWATAAVPDFAHPATRGERPADLAERLAFAGALLRLGAEDAAVHRLMLEVAHLIKPRSAYLEPALLARVRSLMAVP